MLPIYRKGCWSYGNLLTNNVQGDTKKTRHLGSCTQHSFSASCTILPSISNIAQILLALWRAQVFYCPMLFREITQRPKHRELWFLYATCLLYRVYNYLKYHQYISKRVRCTAVTRFLLPNTVGENTRIVVLAHITTSQTRVQFYNHQYISKDAGVIAITRFLLLNTVRRNNSKPMALFFFFVVVFFFVVFFFFFFFFFFWGGGMRHTFLASSTILPSIINISRSMLELLRSHGFYYQIQSVRWGITETVAPKLVFLVCGTPSQPRLQPTKYH